MKRYLFLTAIILFTLSGCEIDDFSKDESLQDYEIIAQWDADTKTELQSDGKVFWSPGDEISVYSASYLQSSAPQLAGGFKFTSDIDHKSSSASFHGSIEKQSKDVIFAIYPYSLSTGFPRPDCFQVNIPTVQEAKENSFDDEVFYSAAVSKNNGLVFYSLCGGIKFSVSHEGIKKVVFSNTAGSPLSGMARFNFNEDNIPTFDESISFRSPHYVTVVAPGDSTFKVGSYYYAVMIPTESPFPIKVEYYRDSSKACYFTEGKTTINRSVFKRLFNKDAEPEFEKYEDKNAAVLYTMLPDIDCKQLITEVYFHTSNPKTTEYNFGTEQKPVYYELNGTVANYYSSSPAISIEKVANAMFSNWEKLTKVDLSGVISSDVSDFSFMFAGCNSLKHLDLRDLNTSSAVNMEYMFQGCSLLESIDLSSFNTSQVRKMNGMFSECRNLSKLILDSFDTRNCTDVSYMFSYCRSLQILDLNSFELSNVSNVKNMCHNLAIHRKNCIIRSSNETKEILCSKSAAISYAAQYYFINWIGKDTPFPPLEDPFKDFYKSTDYSKDKTSRVLQTATVGKGINIMIIGDGYSDRLIADGTYDRDLTAAIDELFSEEPLKSLRNYFNVNISYAVSENENVQGVTALDVIYEDFTTHMSGADGIVDDYARQTYPNYGRAHLEGKCEPYILVLSNSKVHAGTSYLFCDCQALILFPLGTDNFDFHGTICHEFGHGFGLLADEYWESNETFSEQSLFILKSNEGYYANIDIINNPSSVKWARFIADLRYCGEGIGVYEGGFAYYSRGIWRPTENSLMRTMATGFNAPSREAIYKRANELAFDNWQYDYEKFVEFDQKNATKSSISKTNYRDYILKPLYPPVFVDDK